MSAAWIDSLNASLRRGLQGGRWQRVERARDGRWLALPDDPGRDSVAWHVLDLDAGTQTPLHPFDDATLKGLVPAISRALHAGATIQLLAHKVARRAVLKVQRDDAPRLVKVYRKDRSLHLRWHSVQEVEGVPWRTPRVLDWDAERRILSTEWCPGRSLNQRWKAGQVETEDGERLAQVLELLVRQPVPDALPAWTPADEIGLLQNRLAEFEEVLEHPPGAAWRLIDEVCRALDGHPDGAVFCHRDFHDKQILVFEEREGGSLIDLDLVARGPLGLDAGNLIAHVRLRALQRSSLPWERLVNPLVSRAVALGHDGLHVWVAATLARLALLYCRRQHQPGLIDQLLKSAADALERTGEWQGVLP